jgi:hypothetical protein
MTAGRAGMGRGDGGTVRLNEDLKGAWTSNA